MIDVGFFPIVAGARI